MASDEKNAASVSSILFCLLYVISALFLDLVASTPHSKLIPCFEIWIEIHVHLNSKDASKTNIVANEVQNRLSQTSQTFANPCNPG